MYTGKIAIKLKTLVLPDLAEQLEEKLRDCLREWDIGAVIEDSITGNTTTTDDREEDEEERLQSQKLPHRYRKIPIIISFDKA